MDSVAPVVSRRTGAAPFPRVSELRAAQLAATTRAIFAARRIGIPLPIAVGPADDIMRVTALGEVIESLGSDDPQVLAFWIALWWSPLSVGCASHLAAHVGVPKRRLLKRAASAGLSDLATIVRHARLTRIQALCGAGVSRGAIAQACGLSSAAALQTLTTAHQVTLDPYQIPGPVGLALRYVRAFVRPQVSAFRTFAPFQRGPRLARAMECL